MERILKDRFYENIDFNRTALVGIEKHISNKGVEQRSCTFVYVDDVLALEQRNKELEEGIGQLKGTDELNCNFDPLDLETARAINKRLFERLDDKKKQLTLIKDYENALKEISRQKTLEEMKDNLDYMDEDGDFIGDFEFAYDELVKVARQALENNLEKHKEAA